MAPLPVMTSAADLISRIEAASPKIRYEILTELYNSGKHNLDSSVDLENKVAKLTQQLSDRSSVEDKLKLEIKDLNSAATENLKSTAVLEYKLSEAEKRIEGLLSGTGLAQPNLLPRSEPYIIDRKFTGEDRSLYQVFQKEIKIALKRNADRYTTFQSQVGLIYQNLGLGPKSFLDRYLLDDGKYAFTTLKQVWDVLDVSFRNPNEEADARDALSRLKQGSRLFGVYLAEFQRLQNLTGIKDDKTLISYMRSGVSNNLSICIGQQQVFDKEYSFDEFVVLCKQCVIRLEWMRQVAPRDTRNPNPNPTTSNPTPRVTNPTLPRIVHDTRPHYANPSKPIQTHNVNDPMILDQNQLSHIGPDEHITPEDRLRRFRLNLCMRCRKPGHRVDVCQSGKKHKFIQQLELQDLNGGVPLEPESEDLKD